MTGTPRSPFWPGVLSPLVSAFLGAGTYLVLTRLSANPDADYLFRLGAVAVVMLLPPAFALHRAWRGYRDGGLRWTGWVAVSVALLSLGLVTVPIGGAVRRARQAANLARASSTRTVFKPAGSASAVGPLTRVTAAPARANASAMA